MPRSGLTIQLVLELSQFTREWMVTDSSGTGKKVNPTFSVDPIQTPQKSVSFSQVRQATSSKSSGLFLPYFAAVLVILGRPIGPMLQNQS